MPFMGSILQGPNSPNTITPALPSPAGNGQVTHVVLATPRTPPAWCPAYLPPVHTGPNTPLSSPLTRATTPATAGRAAPGAAAWPSPPPHLVALAARHVLASPYRGPNGTMMVPVLAAVPGATYAPLGTTASVPQPAPLQPTQPSAELSSALDELAQLTASSCPSESVLQPNTHLAAPGRSQSAHFDLSPGHRVSAAGAQDTRGVSQQAGSARTKQQQGGSGAEAALGRRESDVLDVAPPVVPNAHTPIPFRGDDPFRASVLPFQPPAAGARNSPARAARPGGPASTLSGRWGPASAAAVRAASHAYSPTGATHAHSLAASCDPRSGPSLDELVRGQLFSLDLTLRPSAGGSASGTGAIEVPAPGEDEAYTRLAAAGVVKPASKAPIPTLLAPLGLAAGTAAGHVLPVAHTLPEGALAQAMHKGRWV